MRKFELIVVLAIVLSQCLALSIREKRQNGNESNEEDFDDDRNRNWSPDQGGFVDPDEFSGENFPGQGQNFPGQGQNFPGQGQNFPGQGQNFPNQGQNFPSQGQNQNFPGRRPTRPNQSQNNGQRQTASSSLGQNASGQGQNIPSIGQDPLFGGNSRRPSTSRTRRPQTNATTPRASVGSSTTQSSSVQTCIRNCPVTPEYNPVCGTDSVTYDNPGRLTCAQACGVNVSLLRMQRCPTTTTTAAPRQ